MEYLNKIAIVVSVLAFMLPSCGGHKGEKVESEAESPRTMEYSPMDLYFMQPTAMLVSPGGGDDRTAYLPDFINYPNDLVKFGLRGYVKECIAGVSTIRFTYSFNKAGNLTNYQFRMDSRGYFGEGARIEYDSAGHITLLGRDFRGQSANSHTYVYENDVLVRREYGGATRVYEWIKDDNGSMIPERVANKGLKPAMDMVYERNTDGHVVLAGMSYDNPKLPGSLKAKKGVSKFEYFSDGRLKIVKTSYTGCSDKNNHEMDGECEYTYNANGDVEKMVWTLYSSGTGNRRQLHSLTQTYTYSYDDHGNWISVNMQSSDPQSGTISSFTRTFTYYSEDEINTPDEKKIEEPEKPFIGRWIYEDKEDLGDGEWLKTNCAIAANLYEKTIEGFDGKMLYGGISSGYDSSNGIYKMTPWDIVSAKTTGNTARIEILSGNTGDIYSVTLSFNPKTQTLTVSDVTLKEEAELTDEEYPSNVADIPPVEGVYKFYKNTV